MQHASFTPIINVNVNLPFLTFYSKANKNRLVHFPILTVEFLMMLFNTILLCHTAKEFYHNSVWLILNYLLGI